MLREGRQVCLVLPSFRNLFSDKWFTSLSSVFSWQTYLLLPPDSGQQVLAEVSDALLACLMGGALFLKGLGKTGEGQPQTLAPCAASPSSAQQYCPGL